MPAIPLKTDGALIRSGRTELFNLIEMMAPFRVCDLWQNSRGKLSVMYILASIVYRNTQSQNFTSTEQTFSHNVV